MSSIIRGGTAVLIAATRADPPSRVAPLSADPLFCASCLRIALGRGETELALQCASTLSVFDPNLLWKTLALSVLDDHGGEAHRLLPLALSAATAAKKLASVWPIAEVLIQRISRAPKSRFFLLAARCLTHDFYAPADDCKCGRFPQVDLAHWEAGQRIIASVWAPTVMPVRRTSCSLLLELQRLSEFRTWDHLDLAEAVWKATRSPSALAFAALEWGEPTCPDPADCPTTEVALNHATTRGRQWLKALPFMPPELDALPDVLRLDAFGEALTRVETESWLSERGELIKAQLCSLSGLTVSNAIEMMSSIRANLPHIRENRRTYLDNLHAQKPAYSPSNRL